MYFDLITLCGALSTLPVLWGIWIASRKESECHGTRRLSESTAGQSVFQFCLAEGEK